MADIQKRLEKAEKYLQKGKQEDALNEYFSILDDEPNNDAVRQQAADLCVTLGMNQDAAELLGVLFDRQAAINDQVKAIANYKKLARLGTPSVDQTFKFAQFVEKNDRKAALDAYHLVANSFLAADRRDEALAASKRIVYLDPSAVNHKNLGELAATLGDKRAAAASFYALAELEPEKTAQWLDRSYALDPDHPQIALAYGRSLTQQGKAEQAEQVLAPLAAGAGAAVEAKDAYVKALLAAGRPQEAEPLLWELFEKDPAVAEVIGDLIGLYVRQENTERALALAEKLEAQMNKQGKRREYVALMKDVISKNPPGEEFLEYMVGVYNQANREHDYCDTLNSLFQLYFASGKYLKAADSLDRVAEVDPYETGNQKRLEMLRGKIDQRRFDAIANRFHGVAGAGTTEEKPADTSLEQEPTMLEDFLLQAEIFIQYGMRSKALERIERIYKLFPHEEERNEKLRALYNSAGFVPKYDAEAAAPAAPAPAPQSFFGQAPSYAPPVTGAAPAAASAAGPNPENAVDNFARVTEITRNIYRQSTVKGVLFAAVNDVGRHFQSSRCIAGLISPGKPPSAALEYCAPGTKQSDVQHLVKLLAAVQHLSLQSGIVAVDDVRKAPGLGPVKEAVTALGIHSLLAAPLLDAATDEQVGLLMLEQCGQVRGWRPTDSVVLKTIADQMVLAVNNAKLRSLMKNLAVTDEKSGLLKRSSYLDVLLSETRRSLQQNSTASVLLFHFGKPSALVKEMGEQGVENMMQQIGQSICSQIRQNDVAVRYDLTTIALILPDTTDKNSFFVVDKMRKVLTSFKVGGSDRALHISVGIAEAVMHSEFDPIDIVTEVINRAEAALEAARAEGPDAAKSLAPQFQTAAA
jgi:diguanylate cyclase (GGDEF)-like protein